MQLSETLNQIQLQQVSDPTAVINDSCRIVVTCVCGQRSSMSTRSVVRQWRKATNEPLRCRSCVISPTTRNKIGAAIKASHASRLTPKTCSDATKAKISRSITQLLMDEQHRNKLCNNIDIRAQQARLTTEEFVVKATALWGDTYDYSNTVYEHYHALVNVTCKIHGEFTLFAHNHLRNCGGCPSCRIGGGQYDIMRYIKSLDDQLTIMTNDRQTIKPYELDIFIPSKNLAFEFNGAYYHSHNQLESPQERRYHSMKAELAAAKNINLVQIDECDWTHKNDICQSIIKHKLGKSIRIGARQTTAQIITAQTYREFIQSAHLQGYKPATHIVGLHHSGELLSVMAFTNRNDRWEVERYATKPGHAVIGGASKLFNAFITTIKPSKVFTYADRSISDAGVYLALGFKHVGYTQPGYCYIKRTTKLSRMACQKHKLASLLGDRFDPTKSEANNMFACGYRRMWNAGNHKLEWSAAI